MAKVGVSGSGRELAGIEAVDFEPIREAGARDVDPTVPLAFVHLLVGGSNQVAGEHVGRERWLGAGSS